MLRALHIHDMVLIERAEIAFGTGLNVLTGETGAGKSILLDSLGFVLGWRTRAGLVRAGAEQGEVTAEFVLPEGHPAGPMLEAAGVPRGETLLLRRTLTAEGGRRLAWINDRRVTAETLRALGDVLVELHGQQDDRGLLDARRHRVLLDEFAGAAGALAEVRRTWEARAGAERELVAVRAVRDAAARDAEFLGHAVSEFDKLDPQPGEEPELDARRRQLRAAEAIRADIAFAAEALGVEGAEGAIFQALRRLEDAAPKAEGALDAVLDALGQVLTGLGHVTGEVEEIAGALGGDPGELDAVEERLFALRGLARKHNVLAEELPALADEMRARLRSIDGAGDEIARLETMLAAAEAAHRAACAELSALRREAASRLDTRMAEELPPLKLDRARFVTEVAEAEPGPEGADRVRFTAATNPGAPAGPIDRIASGGELSRFLLALKVCLSEQAEGVTLVVFDEIDRGVGGATADAVGQRLEALGGSAQVLVVTHSPQVAARGAHHWRVGKAAVGEGTRTDVVALDADARVEEIARMLAGDTVTPAARAAAQALLAERVG